MVNDIIDEYKGDIEIVIVYMREAHPGQWNFTDIEQPETWEQRVKLARSMRVEFDIKVPILVTAMDNTVQRNFGGLPNMAFLVGKGGKVLYKEPWANPAAWPPLFDKLLEHRAEHAGAPDPEFNPGPNIGPRAGFDAPPHRAYRDPSAGAGDPDSELTGDGTGDANPVRDERDLKQRMRTRLDDLALHQVSLEVAIRRVTDEAGVPFDLADEVRDRVSGITVDLNVSAGRRLDGVITELLDAHGLDAEVAGLRLAIFAKASLFPEGTAEYDRFMEVTAEILPAGHRALAATDVTAALDRMRERDRTRLRKMLEHLSRQNREDQLLRDLRKAVRDFDN